MKRLERPDIEKPDTTRCAACLTKMDVRERFFICANCVRALPDDLRRGILYGDHERQWDEMHAMRVAALRHLGAPNAYDTRERRVRESKPEECKHELAQKLQQINLITGSTDSICSDCGRIRYGQS